jgi:hypothetical protein
MEKSSRLKKCQLKNAIGINQMGLSGIEIDQMESPRYLNLITSRAIKEE